MNCKRAHCASFHVRNGFTRETLAWEPAEPPRPFRKRIAFPGPCSRRSAAGLGNVGGKAWVPGSLHGYEEDACFKVLFQARESGLLPGSASPDPLLRYGGREGPGLRRRGALEGGARAPRPRRRKGSRPELGGRRGSLSASHAALIS